jgi:hypothetical protein
LLWIATIGCGGPETTAPSGTSGKINGVVEIDGVRSQAPDEWLQERPSNEFRLAQFRLPGPNGADATLVIFRGIGGTAKQNVDRWKDQFPKKDGEPKVDANLRIGHMDAVVLDVQGTFDEGSGMRNPQAPPPQPHTDYRMIAIHLEGRQGPYHIKLTGPAKTVERYKKGFDDWLHGFK